MPGWLHFLKIKGRQNSTIYPTYLPFVTLKGGRGLITGKFDHYYAEKIE